MHAPWPCGSGFTREAIDPVHGTGFADVRGLTHAYIDGDSEYDCVTDLACVSYDKIHSTHAFFPMPTALPRTFPSIFI